MNNINNLFKISNDVKSLNLKNFNIAMEDKEFANLVYRLEMPKEEAIKMGAECEFIERYPDIVTVYKIGDVSTEICGGPHVSNTSELGKFKIKKEESSSAGVRRIKAVLIEE